MHKINKYTLYFFLLVLVFSLTGCNKKKIISQKEMAQIICEMYLADQFVNEYPHYREQKDTSLLFDAILHRHGYDKKTYWESVEYYLSDKDSYKQINIRARDIIEKQKAEVDAIIGSFKSFHSWQSDTMRFLEPREYNSNPQLRTYKWLVMDQTPYTYRFDDSLYTDSPMFGDWWENNINLPGDGFSLTQYDIKRDSIKNALENDRQERRRRILIETEMEKRKMNQHNAKFEEHLYSRSKKKK